MAEVFHRSTILAVACSVFLCATVLEKQSQSGFEQQFCPIHAFSIAVDRWARNITIRLGKRVIELDQVAFLGLLGFMSVGFKGSNDVH